MSADEHKTPSTSGKFCVLRAENCGHNKYIENARAKAPGWATFSFKARKYFKEDNTIKTHDKHPEAHHILCVSSVREGIIGNPAIQPLVRETDWCVNRSSNMRPMPLWGHTVQHYCNPMPGMDRVASEGYPPRFQNVPQHNFDHNCELGYRHEVETDILDLAKQVEKAIEGHEIKPEDIAAELDDMSKKFNGVLRARGDREGGTHNAWKMGIRDPDSRWYLPFSMASAAAVTKRGFPPFNDKTAEWMERIAFAMWGDS